MAKAHAKPTIKVGTDGMPQRLKWRVVVRPKPLIGGLLVDLAFEVILQQAGIQTFEWPQVIRALAVGFALGILMPSLGLALAVRAANKEIDEARAAVLSGADRHVVAKEMAEAKAASVVAIARGAQTEQPQAPMPPSPPPKAPEEVPR